MLFHLQIPWDFPTLFLLVISGLTPLWPESILCVISILLNLLRYALCPSMWSVLENVLCEPKKNVYSTVDGWSIMSFKSGCSVQLSYCYSVAQLYQLLIEGIEVSNYYDEFIYFSLQFSFFALCISILLLGTYTWRIVISSWRIDSFIIM